MGGGQLNTSELIDYLKSQNVKLTEELDAANRVSCAMATALGDISEVLGMDENDAHTLSEVKALLTKANAAERWREKAASLAYALGFVIGLTKGNTPDWQKLISINEFVNIMINANLEIDLSNFLATDEVTNNRGEPEVIYLQLHGDEYEQPADYKNGEITWCWHKIDEPDVRYIRGDIVATLAVPDVIPSTFRAWWAMIEADSLMIGKPLNDSDIALSFTRNGGSCQVTAGDIRKMVNS